MELYVVLEYEYFAPADEEGTFIGVYSTKEKAEEARQALSVNSPEFYYEIGVTTLDHDPIIDGGATLITFDRWRKEK